jgi:hypothetical protein
VTGGQAPPEEAIHREEERVQVDVPADQATERDVAKEEQHREGDRGGSRDGRGQPPPGADPR